MTGHRPATNDLETRVHDPTWAPDMARFATHLSRRLHNEGHPWADLAAALITARGTTSLSRDEFADRLHLEDRLLAALEDGTERGPEPEKPSVSKPIGPRL